MSRLNASCGMPEWGTTKQGECRRDCCTIHQQVCLRWGRQGRNQASAALSPIDILMVLWGLQLWLLQQLQSQAATL